MRMNHLSWDKMLHGLKKETQHLKNKKNAHNWNMWSKLPPYFEWFWIPGQHKKKECVFEITLWSRLWYIS